MTISGTKANPAEALAARYPGVIPCGDVLGGDLAFRTEPASLREVLGFLRDEPGLEFNFLMDVSGVDYLTHPTPRPKRYEVAYQLYSLRWGHRLRIRVALNPGESVPTVSDLWASADWGERETWEMYGIVFDGHPNLKRLLTHKDFVGHPLRKDYPTKKRQALSESDTLVDEMEQRLRFKGLK